MGLFIASERWFCTSDFGELRNFVLCSRFEGKSIFTGGDEEGDEPGDLIGYILNLKEGLGECQSGYFRCDTW